MSRRLALRKILPEEGEPRPLQSWGRAFSSGETLPGERLPLQAQGPLRPREIFRGVCPVDCVTRICMVK